MIMGNHPSMSTSFSLHFGVGGPKDCHLTYPYFPYFVTYANNMHVLGWRILIWCTN